jgi:hypothetical protein
MSHGRQEEDNPPGAREGGGTARPGEPRVGHPQPASEGSREAEGRS